MWAELLYAVCLRAKIDLLEAAEEKEKGAANSVTQGGWQGVCAECSYHD